MRELEFRAWDQVKKKMVKCYIHHEGVAIEAGYNIVTCPTPPRFLLPMQYTGLKDKNGVKIFGGDILAWCNGPINSIDLPYGGFEIKYSDGNHNVPMWGTKEQFDSTHWFEIIGNIHENPELLEIK